MPFVQVASNVYCIPLGYVNAYLVQGAELVLVDTGVPGSTDAILGAVRELGKEPRDIKHILVTHLHPDHTGSLAALKRETGAPAYMHPLDAAAVRVGQGGRPTSPRPGAPPEVLEMLKRMQQRPLKLEPAEIEYELKDGAELPFLPAARVLHVPGHAAGQLAFLLPDDNGVLIAADTSGNVTGLEYAPIYEDFELGKASLQKLAQLEFAVACFGHGEAIPGDAAARFREKWG
jgi:glyoxylase-like metal-dependent hydrolase (beta-lactamase superfamily II)